MQPLYGSDHHIASVTVLINTFIQLDYHHISVIMGRSGPAERGQVNTNSWLLKQLAMKSGEHIAQKL